MGVDGSLFDFWFGWVVDECWWVGNLVSFSSLWAPFVFLKYNFFY